MANITISIPEEIKNKMETFPEINWSRFLRSVIEDKTSKLSWKEETLSKLKKEEESGIIDWSVRLGKKSHEGRYEELKKKGLV